jgi:sugar phosphate isomerase/epimerase
MPKFGLIKCNFPGPLEEFLDFAAEAGFDCVEISIESIADPHQPDAEKGAEAVRELVSERGLEISAVSARNDFVVLDEAQVQAQVHRMWKVCRLAKIAGTRVLRTEGGWPKDEVPEDRWVEAIIDCLHRCQDFIELENVVLAIDNHGLVTNRPGALTRICQAVGSFQVGVNVDFMNWRWYGHPAKKVAELVREVAPLVRHTHVKDGVGAREKYEGRVLGKGEVPLKDCVAALEEAGYRGVWCAEYEGSDPEARDGYRRCLEWMQAHIKD